MNNNVLICKGVRFGSQHDEDAFFEWLKKINCIDSISGQGRKLYLHIACTDLHDDDLRDLLALFHRYKIDMKQLRIFLNDKNKEWFFDNKLAYWHRKVFGTTSKQSYTNILL